MVVGLQKFGLQIDEGAVSQDGSERGDYGPYSQSERGDIYRTYVKELVTRGGAYPCFLGEEETTAIREEQSLAKQPL